MLLQPKGQNIRRDFVPEFSSGMIQCKQRAGYSIEPRKCTNKQDQENAVFKSAER